MNIFAKNWGAWPLYPPWLRLWFDFIVIIVLQHINSLFFMDYVNRTVSGLPVVTQSRIRPSGQKVWPPVNWDGSASTLDDDVQFRVGSIGYFLIFVFTWLLCWSLWRVDVSGSRQLCDFGLFRRNPWLTLAGPLRCSKPRFPTRMRVGKIFF